MLESIPEITEAELGASERQLWLKGLTAIQQGNEEYAVNLILPAVINAPGFLEGRKALRKCQFIAKGDAGGGGTKVFGLSIGSGAKGASSKTKALAKKDPKAALEAIEKELTEAPNSPELNDLLHNCAAVLGMPSTAEFALETVHKHMPSQTKLLHKLATFYIQNQKFNEAAEVYKTITAQDPTDSTSVKGEKDCIAKASMLSSTQVAADGGLTLKMRDDSERIKLEQAAKTGLTKEQLAARVEQLLAQYQADQHNLNVAKDLAETYAQLDDYNNSYAFFDWAFQLSQGDKTLQAKANEMKQRASAQYIRSMEDAISADPENEELKAQLKEFKISSMQEHIAASEQAVEDNPTDGVLRYELGKAYFDAEQFDQAIPHLQQAKSNPAIETKVLLLLGRPFDAKGMTDMAIDQLNTANQRMIVMDGIKKETLYQLALLFEKAGNKEKYVEYLKEVFSADYGYRDVAQRVEATY